MKLAVAGGTGLVGRLVVTLAREQDHHVTVISRAAGVDLVSGSGLAAALAGCHTVIDVSDAGTVRKTGSIAFFTAATRNLLTIGAQSGVRHHLALSIVGCDRVPFGYYAGKRSQEALIAAGTLPWTVLRATQFHEFPAQLLARTRGPVVAVPRMRSAPVAAREVAVHLLRLATAQPVGLAPELAGPQVLEMPQLTRRLIRARGPRRLVVPVSLPGATGRLMADGALLPTAAGPRGLQTFEEWLAGNP